MRITHGNTVLRSLTEDDLEMVRSWRNDPKINAHLVRREYITEEQQVQWFNELNAQTTLYFVIEEKGIAVGLIYANNIDFTGRSFSGNILMGSASSKGSAIPVKSVVMFFEFMVNQCGFRKVFSVVHQNNRSALTLNRKLGFVTDRKNGNLLEESCTDSRLREHIQRFSRFFFRKNQMKVLAETSDYFTPAKVKSL